MLPHQILSLLQPLLAPVSAPLVGGRRTPIVYAIGIAIARQITLAVTGLALASEHLLMSYTFRAVHTMVPGE
jgi:hypothetical protein